MPDNKHTRRLVALLYIAAGFFVAYLVLKYALAWAAPFVTAYLISRAVEPAVRFLTDKARMKRAPASAICIFIVFAAALALFALLVGRIVYELTAFAKNAPALLLNVSDMLSSADTRFRGWIVDAPPELWGYLTVALEHITAQISDVVSTISKSIIGFLSNAASGAPSFFIFLFTTALSSFFISSGYREIVAFIMRQIPPHRREMLLAMKKDMRGALGGWLRAQIILAGITLAQLLALFLFLRVEFAVILALIGALLDLIPVVGAGLMIVPWAIFALIGGDTFLGAALLIGLLIATVVHNLLAPKLIGSQLGLPPIASLAAMYVGFRAAGFWGMTLFPIGLIIIKHSNDKGYVKLWK